jgi:signal transduction histidine kinase
MARLFDPFFTTKKDVGTGLGLWITKELIEKAGGRIRLRSKVGERSGTVVSVFHTLQN